MKQIFILLMVAMCATMFTACSKDDDKDPLDDNGGNGSKEGMITMIAENDEIEVDIETFNEGDIITIDWGDGTVEEFKSVEEYYEEDEIHYVISIDSYVEHEYSNRNPHIITIKGKISEFCQGEGSWYNNITSLNVSKCPALTVLDCAENNLTSLDVSKNTALTYLFCKRNNLTSLDVSKCPVLTELGCWSNKLTSLDVSKNTALTRLNCEDNKLTSSALNQIFRDLPQGKTWTEGHGYTEQSSIFISRNPGTDTCDKSIAENKGWEVNTIR